ncbi:MAG: DUF3536 domain-containing protein [Ktedonobacteraceae bacterium]|nr:DUF3536 domain-containing protein [Ktedonobacteraceae bacterium]
MFTIDTKTGLLCFCIHGHFYQPPRYDPFTGLIASELGATPFANYNEKITWECYQPNAEADNFASISFNLGPTLASWLERAHPDVYQHILASEQQHMQRYGVSNALAQGYNHTILPLASTRDKRTQILWGLQDYEHRYGHKAHGMWLAETATDLESLDLMAQAGITYTILAPWQAACEIDRSEPYYVHLHNGRRMIVFFYNGPTSGGVSFEDHLTNDANMFAASELQKHRQQDKSEHGEPQMLLIATDGELYGHHKPYRDRFLSHLLRYGAPSYGFEVCTLERYLLAHPPTREIQLHEPSSWSCIHGVERWRVGCSCDGTQRDEQRQWKAPLRMALNHLASACDRLFEQYASETLHDPWSARDDYLALHQGWETPEHFWKRHSKHGQAPRDIASILQTSQLLEAQYYMQQSFTSCGFFFEDVARIEPRNDIAFARKAISLLWQATDIDLQHEFVCELAHVQSWQAHLSGADLYRELPAVPSTWLPLLEMKDHK